MVYSCIHIGFYVSSWSSQAPAYIANAIPFIVLGGVMFKVYIVGETIKVVRRFSLPDVCKRELSNIAGVFRFPRVSCAAASADNADLDPGVAGELSYPWLLFVNFSYQLLRHSPLVTSRDLQFVVDSETKQIMLLGGFDAMIIKTPFPPRNYVSLVPHAVDCSG